MYVTVFTRMYIKKGYCLPGAGESKHNYSCITLFIMRVVTLNKA